MSELLKINKFFSFSLLIQGDKIEPQFFTDFFNVEPNESFRLNDEFTSKADPSKKFKRRSGLWSLCSLQKIDAVDDESHRDFVLSKLNSPNEKYYRELKEKNLKVYFFFGVDSSAKSKKENKRILKQFLHDKYGELLEQYKAEIWIDINYDDGTNYSY